MNKNESLVSHLKKSVRVLRSHRLEEAFRAVPRADFVPDELQVEAYEDYPLPIGGGQTISQPTTVAFMLEKLGVEEGDRVLDVGSGSGWTTALLAHLVGEKGKVLGVEIVPGLVAFGQKNLVRFYSYVPRNVRASKNNVRNLPRAEEQAEIRQAERDVIGLPDEAPFDRILVSAAAEKIPAELIEQLAVGGKMVIPARGTAVGDFGSWHQTATVNQSLFVVEKLQNGELRTQEFPGFAFVPLIE